MAPTRRHRHHLASTWSYCRWYSPNSNWCDCVDRFCSHSTNHCHHHRSTVSEAIWWSVDHHSIWLTMRDVHYLPIVSHSTMNWCAAAVLMIVVVVIVAELATGMILMDVSRSNIRRQPADSVWSIHVDRYSSCCPNVSKWNHDGPLSVNWLKMDMH